MLHTTELAWTLVADRQRGLRAEADARRLVRRAPPIGARRARPAWRRRWRSRWR